MRRYVTLGDGKRVSLGSYVRVWRFALGLPTGTPLSRDLQDRWPSERETVVRQFRAGMHDRISRHLPWYGRGRKWCHDWQRAATQCAAAVNTPRLIVRWVPRDLRARLQHRLWQGE